MPPFYLGFDAYSQIRVNEKKFGAFQGKEGPFPWSSFPLSAPNGAYCVRWRKTGNYPIRLRFFQEK
jgi:hypothetical protein